jgi:WD40 repeat protein
MLVSAATRSVRLWDLETNQLNSDMTGTNLNSFVRCLAIVPDKQLLAAACDKVITLWDLRTSNNEGVLRGHKDEVRTMHVANNYLFSAGKGLTNSGALFVWDLRYLNFNSPM